MIILKTEEQIQRMREAGMILAALHKEIAKIIKPGISTMEIDRFVEEYLEARGAYPEQKGYRNMSMPPVHL